MKRTRTTAPASASWEIDLFGRLRRGNESAVAAYLATEEARRAALVTLVADVASTYLLLRELDLQLEVARRTVQITTRRVRAARRDCGRRLQPARGGPGAVANRSRTAVAIPQLEHQIAVSEDPLCLLLGRPPGPIDRAGLSRGRTSPSQVPVGLPASLLERRPDVLASEQLLVASNADVGAAKALFFPTISLTGLFGTSAATSRTS